VSLIAAPFVLLFALILLLQVGVTDTIKALRTIAREVDAAVGHDIKVFPDHIDP